MCWPACRALSELSVTCLIRVSGVRERAFVQWCSMTDVCTVGQDTSCRQIVELLRFGGWPGLDVCPLPHSLRQCPTVSTSYPVWQHWWHTWGGVGVSSGQDVVEIFGSGMHGFGLRWFKDSFADRQYVLHSVGVIFHTQYINHVQSIYTLSHVVLSCQYSPVSVLQLWPHSPPDSSVRGCALRRRGCHPVSYWSVEEEEGGVWGVKTNKLRTLSTYLPLILSRRWSHLLMPLSKKHQT